MKPLLTAIALVLLFLLPAPLFSAYIIHLHDGTKFVTDQYFEEGDQIKFNRYGGLIGIEKDRVREIEESEDLPEEKTPLGETEAATKKGETEKQKTRPDQSKGRVAHEEGQDEDGEESERVKENSKGEPREVSKNGEKSASQTVCIKEYWEKKKALKIKLDKGIEVMREAAENNDFAKRKEMIEEVRKISKEIHRITDEVKQMNNGRLPDFWED